MSSRILTILVLTLAFGISHAQEEEEAVGGGFLQAPTIEPSPVTGESVEPDITITESGSDIVYEYRVRGMLYMVRVQPQVGPPYYLFDHDGDGIIDAQERSARNSSIPQWVLFRWN
ncbi:DUF2782 domain-containing protein [Thiocystis minor]|uniref:DUF2782 domain-containing protein n=1 Tax=Thiocystis minor TaxID=61597 RepID=UPI0030B8B045